MSSLLRAPKVNGEGRVLSVDKITPAQRTRLENSDATKFAPVKDRDEIVISNRETAGETADEKDISELEALHTDYSQEVERQVSEVRSKLISVTEELESLKVSIEEKRETAKKEGFEEGYNEGLTDAKNETIGKLESLEKLIESISSARQESIAAREDELVEIVYAAVTKLLGNILNTKDGVVAAIRNVSQYVNKRDKLVFRVSEKDYQLLKDIDKRSLIVGDAKEINVIADQHVQLGGCIVETTAGSLDSRLEVQLKNLMETLKTVNAINTSKSGNAGA